MLTIGVDVGGTSVRAAVVDSDGAILDTARAATPGQDRALEAAIVGVIDELSARHAVSAVGVALAGFVTPDRRTVRFAPHLPWRDVRVADRLAQRCTLPVVIEHDANAAALAERRFGAASGSGARARSTLFVALGTGIGAALLIDGKLYRGAHGVAPELGHIRVMPDGRACPCGKRGCWERYCSGTALVTTLVELLASDQGASTNLTRLASVEARGITGRHVATAARDGDPLGRQAMAELARWLGEGLALIADVYDPELVVIGGGVSGSAPLFLDDAREHYARVLTGGQHRPLARIRTAQLGEEAGVIGAAEIAREAVS
ncbi:ROK family protein [Pseudonocardia spinosispora]|uniref:ROK family protein n=1 Tax=Pseudonocardia spinosispora TaxID=103441 RepID=UPI0003F81A6C|nr:ROK family protein [Pseudonocardia spinosispora]